MPGSLTYVPRTPDDPSFVSVGPYSFQANKKLGNIDDQTIERLKGNPWFTPGKDAQKAAEAAVAPQPQIGDSSVNLAPPPGSGSKTDPGALVKTGDGLVPAEDASLVDGVNTLDDDAGDGDGKGRKSRARG